MLLVVFIEGLINYKERLSSKLEICSHYRYFQINTTIDNATLSHSQYVKTKKQHVMLLILCKWLFLSLDKHILKNRQVAMNGQGTNFLECWGTLLTKWTNYSLSIVHDNSYSFPPIPFLPLLFQE
jgi:hypothetical protein